MSVPISLPTDDVADDAQSPDTADIRNKQLQSQVHLHECLVHPVDPGCCLLDERLSVPEVAAQCGNLCGRAEAAPQEAHGVQVS
jgi:hypothetical protein